MKSYRNIIFILVTAFAILIQLANPTLAYADGGTEPPPPTEVATEETPPAIPVATEVPSVVDSQMADPVVAEEPVLLEILEQLPPQTDIVVLDGTGQVIPLATQEAAEIVAISDPMWCPAGVTIITAAACKNDVTVAGLITQLTAKDQDGVIYFTSAYGTNDATFDGTNLNLLLLADNKLTLQGGWNGDTTEGNSIVYSGQSVFSVPITITNWQGNVTVNDIKVNGVTTGSGLAIRTTQDVNINDSTFSGNSYGAYVPMGNNVSIVKSDFSGSTNTGAYVEIVNNVSIADSTFGGNQYGMVARNVNNDVTITNSTFNNNGNDGAYIRNVNDVSTTNSTFNNNGYDGAWIRSVNDVSTTTSTFNNNGYDGAWIQSVNDVSIVNSEFSGNAWKTEVGYEWVGAGIDTANHVTISNGRFNENDVGVVLYDVNSASITGSTFNKNRDAGLYASLATGVSNITISNSVFSENAYYGIDVRADDDATINLTIDCDNVRYQNTGTNLYTEGNVISNVCDDDEQVVIMPVEQAIISIPPSQDVAEFEMDCSLYDSYLIKWVGGDRVVLSCVERGRALVSRVDNTILPNDLPAGFEYASAIAVEIFQNGVPLDLLPVTGVVQLVFSSRDENPNYGIVYWDEENGEWIVLKDYQLNASGGSVSFPLHSSNPQDVYRVLSGVRPIVDGNRYHTEVTINFPGIFVLAQH